MHQNDNFRFQEICIEVQVAQSAQAIVCDPNPDTVWDPEGLQDHTQLCCIMVFAPSSSYTVLCIWQTDVLSQAIQYLDQRVCLKYGLSTFSVWSYNTDQCQTSLSYPKSLRKLFSASSQTICWPTIYSILISQLTVPVIAWRQPFSRLSMTISLLSMKIKSRFWLCWIYLLPLILLTNPFFCHVLVTLLLYPTLSLLGSLPISLIAPKLSL